MAGALSWRSLDITHSFIRHIFLAHALGAWQCSRHWECSSEQSTLVPIPCGVGSSEGRHASEQMTRRGQPREKQPRSAGREERQSVLLYTHVQGAPDGNWTES